MILGGVDVMDWLEEKGAWEEESEKNERYAATRWRGKEGRLSLQCFDELR